MIILGQSGNHFLGVHPSYDLAPVTMDSFLFELVADGVYQPIGQQPQVKVGHRVFIFLMIDGAQIKVSFQYPKRGFDLTDRVVKLP
jgi:hypothetical protein